MLGRWSRLIGSAPPQVTHRCPDGRARARDERGDQLDPRREDVLLGEAVCPAGQRRAQVIGRGGACGGVGGGGRRNGAIRFYKEHV